MNIDTYLNSGIIGKKANSHPLVSVIVPAYNVEAYIEKCINSILRQTYENLEVFIVDDGSTDRTPRICDDLAIKDQRIKVIHQNNRGIGGARNAALDRIQGEYVLFVDSDDWLPTYAIQLEVNYIVNYGVDLVCFKMGYSPDGDSFPLYEPFIGKLRKLDAKQTTMAYLGVNSIPFNICACNKMYKRCLWSERRFTEKVNYEDLDIMFWVIHDVQKSVFVNEYCYIQLVRPNSVIQSRLKRRDLHLLKITENMLTSAREWYGEDHVLFGWTLYKAIFEELGLLKRIQMATDSQCEDSDLSASEILEVKNNLEDRIRERLVLLEKYKRKLGFHYYKIRKKAKFQGMLLT